MEHNVYYYRRTDGMGLDYCFAFTEDEARECGVQGVLALETMDSHNAAWREYYAANQGGNLDDSTFIEGRIKALTVGCPPEANQPFKPDPEHAMNMVRLFCKEY